MFKKKNVLSLFMILFFVLGFNNLFADAAAIEGLKESQKEHLKQLGFTEENIASMTIDEYQDFKYAIPAEPFVQEETFYKVISNLEGEVTGVEEYNEKDALKLMELEERMITPFAINTEETSWMSMTTTSTKLTNGRTLLHNNFTWLKNPNVSLSDMVGLTYNDSVVIEPNTIKFSYKYTDGLGEHTLGYKSLSKNAQGIAAIFNLKGIGTNAGTSNHHGYIAVEVSKGNTNDISANAFGHYTHTTLTFSIDVSIKTGDIGLGMATAETKMTNTAIKFNF